jgi:ubiquinone/menaquinone biosynthesis C-methylase UbiE
MAAADLQSHDARIRDQFTKQAIPFAASAPHLTAIRTLIESSGAGPGDRVLDVACGPGLVACEFAKVAGSVVGIDLTEKMIEQALARQRALGLENMEWRLGTIAPLPFADAGFDRVVSRYAFHHLLDPAAAFAEMLRVCRPGGRVLVADVTPPSAKGEAHDAFERLRDDSHVRSIPEEEFEAMFAASGLVDLRKTSYTVDHEIEALLERCFAPEADKEAFRRRARADVGVDALALGAELRDGMLLLHYPITVISGAKAA